MFDVKLILLCLFPYLFPEVLLLVSHFFGVCVLSSWFGALLGFYYLVLFASVD